MALPFSGRVRDNALTVEKKKDQEWISGLSDDTSFGLKQTCQFSKGDNNSLYFYSPFIFLILQALFFSIYIDFYKSDNW